MNTFTINELKGKAIVLGGNVNTDVLHPSRFFSLNDDRVRAGFLGAIENTDAVAKSPVVVAGCNFGCGSSRETGAKVFLLAGVQAVVAGSFARIFHRNLINLGLPAFICPAFDSDAPPDIDPGAPLIVDVHGLSLRSGNKRYPLSPLDPMLKDILSAGGLVPYLEQNP